MNAITFRHEGDFSKTANFFKKLKEQSFFNELDRYAQEGVSALSSATPVDTGKTASSWTYEIERAKDHVSIIWSNTNVNNGVNIALILQLGHGTRNGGYVVGRDYINPALEPVMEKISNMAWEEVTSI